MIIAFIIVVMAVGGFIHNEIVCAERERKFKEFSEKFRKEHPNLEFVDWA